MYDSYKAIFDVRAASYHQAMLEWPRARDDELAAAVALIDPRPGTLVVDAPSGGGYLRGHVPHGVDVVAVETSRGFLDAARGGADSDAPAVLCDAIGTLGLRSGAIDAVINLAGLHHEPDKGAFYREAHRVLRPGGVLGIADVEAGSKVDRFLNGFVDAHSSYGHVGSFLDESACDDLEAAGFVVERAAVQAYPWRFDRERDIGPFCRLMFGIDEADDEEVLAGVHDILGCEEHGHEWQMGWELLFVRARRPA